MSLPSSNLKPISTAYPELGHSLNRCQDLPLHTLLQYFCEFVQHPLLLVNPILRPSLHRVSKTLGCVKLSHLLRTSVSDLAASTHIPSVKLLLRFVFPCWTFFKILWKTRLWTNGGKYGTRFSLRTSLCCLWGVAWGWQSTAAVEVTWHMLLIHI